jgi:hypothetical protein
MKKYAPVVVYTYSRLEHLKKTIAALKDNHLAAESDLFIVSDAAKNHQAEQSIRNLRNFVDSIDGFNSINKIYREKNLGAFESISSAEKSVLSDYGTVISLEDDIVTSRNFLDFINAGLDFYKESDQTLTIAGYCHPIDRPKGYEFDSWNSPWHCPWGYGTWKKKYCQIDLYKNPLSEISNNKELFKILKESGDFILDTLQLDALGKISAVDARICGQMLQRNLHTVMPTKSKVSNIGCDGSGVHSGISNKFDVELDEGTQRTFQFSKSEFDSNDILVKKYLYFMNGGFIERARRQLFRDLRRFEILRLIKRKFVG